MTKRTRSLKGLDKSKRCALSGKLVNGHEVVLAEYAILYVKKMGFVVLPSIFQDWNDFKKLDIKVSEVSKDV